MTTNTRFINVSLVVYTVDGPAPFQEIVNRRLSPTNVMAGNRLAGTPATDLCRIALECLDGQEMDIAFIEFERMAVLPELQDQAAAHVLISAENRRWQYHHTRTFAHAPALVTTRSAMLNLSETP